MFLAVENLVKKALEEVEEKAQHQALKKDQEKTEKIIQVEKKINTTLAK